MNLTQNQIDTLALQLRAKRIRVELLDFNMKTIDSIAGRVIAGSIVADANNDIRRSGNITLSIPINVNATTFLDSVGGFTIASGGKIWLDRYIKIFIGIDNYITGDTVWYKMGVFLINKPTREFSSYNYTISFECIDLMAKITGIRQGQVTGPSTVIPMGEYQTVGGVNTWVKTLTADAIRSIIVELGGFSTYQIYPIPDKYKYLPYEIKVEVSATVYELLNKFMEILSTWQMYFNLDGILIIEPIPSGVDDIIYPINPTRFISDTISCDFENVKNQVVVYGRLNELSFYTDNEEDAGNVQYVDNGDGTSTLVLKYLSMLLSNLTIGGSTFGFLSKMTYNTQPITKISIYAGGALLLSSYPLVGFENSKPQIDTNELTPNQVYFVRIFDAPLDNEGNIDFTTSPSSVIFEFMGKQSVSATIVDSNKESPFYINTNLPSPNFYCGTAYTNTDNYNIGTNYKLTLNNTEPITALEDGTILTFMANYSNLYANGSPYTTISVVNANGENVLESTALPLVQNTWTTTNPQTRPYVLENKLYDDYTIWQLKYDATNRWFVLLGRNPNAISLVCSGGEYDNIYADALANERCLWELFSHSNLNNSIKLGVIPNYILDVNMKIPYRESDSYPSGIDATTPTEYYLTKRIEYPLGLDNSEQSIEAIQIYTNGNLVGSDYLIGG